MPSRHLDFRRRRQADSAGDVARPLHFSISIFRSALRFCFVCFIIAIVCWWVFRPRFAIFARRLRFWFDFIKIHHWFRLLGISLHRLLSLYIALADITWLCHHWRYINTSYYIISQLIINISSLLNICFDTGGAAFRAFLIISHIWPLGFTLTRYISFHHYFLGFTCLEAGYLGFMHFSAHFRIT